MGTQASRGSGGMPPPGNFWKLDAQICYFRHIFTISMIDILYSRYKQHKCQYTKWLDLKNKTKKNFFLIFLQLMVRPKPAGPVSPSCMLYSLSCKCCCVYSMLINQRDCGADNDIMLCVLLTHLAYLVVGSANDQFYIHDGHMMVAMHFLIIG